MSLYFVLNKSLDKYVRVSRHAFHLYISSWGYDIWKSTLFDGCITVYYDKENLVEYYEKPLGFIVEVAKDV